ncbi:MAG TPA: hypothetical protein VFV47_11890, partial [Hyphomicrobiaceae bacterium]|nr:hypothetical protein [Hyphomicrobiaceae bacterium]
AKAIAVERQDPDPEKSVFNGAHSSAIWFLVGFAFELFLKSAIVAKGGRDANIKSVGHDLVKALEMPSSPVLKSWKVPASRSELLTAHTKPAERTAFSFAMAAEKSPTLKPPKQ